MEGVGDAHDHPAYLFQPSGQGVILAEPVIPASPALGVSVLEVKSPGPKLLLPLADRQFIRHRRQHAPAAVKEALDSGDLSINQGYNITRQVRELPEEQRDEAAALAVELEKAKKEIRQCDAEADRRGRIADLFCKAFEKAVLLTPTEENVRIWTECTRMTRA